MGTIDDYIAGWKRRDKVEEERRLRRAQEAAIAARKCACILYEKYGVQKVYLVGSLAEPEAFHDRSDIYQPSLKYVCHSFLLLPMSV